MEDTNVTGNNISFNPFTNKVTGYIHTAIITTILTVSIVWNMVLLICVIKFRSLRKKYVLAVHLFILNLVLAMHHAMTNVYFALTSGECRPLLEIGLILESGYIIIAASLLNMVAIALDKFISIHYPFKYIQLMAKRRIIIQILLIWIMPMVLALSTIPDFLQVTHIQYCPGDTRVHLRQTIIVILCYIITIVLMVVVINCKVLHVAKITQKRVALEIDTHSQTIHQITTERRKHAPTNGIKYINVSLVGTTLLFTPYLISVTLYYTGIGGFTLISLLGMVAYQCMYMYTGLGAFICTFFVVEFRNALRKLICIPVKN